MKINNLTVLILTALISNQAYSSYRLPPKPDYYTGGEFSKEELNHFFDNYKKFTECGTLQQDEIDYLNLFNLNNGDISIYNNTIEDDINKYLSYGHFSVLNYGLSKFDYDNITFEKNNKYCQFKEEFTIPNSHIFIQDQYKTYKNYNRYEKSIDIKNKTLKIDDEVFSISFGDFNKKMDISNSNFQRLEIIDLLGYKDYNIKNNKIDSLTVSNKTSDKDLFYSEDFLKLRSSFDISDNFIDSLFIKNINYDYFDSESNHFNYFNLQELYFIKEGSFRFLNTNIHLFNDKDSFNSYFEFNESHVDSFDIKNVKYEDFSFDYSFSRDAIFKDVDMINFSIFNSTIKYLDYKGKIRDFNIDESYSKKINLNLDNRFLVEKLSFSNSSIDRLNIEAKNTKSTQFSNTNIKALNLSGFNNQLSFEHGFIEDMNIEINKLNFDSDGLRAHFILIRNSDIESINASFYGLNEFVFEDVFFKDNPNYPIFSNIESLEINNSVINNNKFSLNLVDNLEIKNTYLKNKIFTFDFEESYNTGDDYKFGINIDPSTMYGLNKTISFDGNYYISNLDIDFNLIKEYDSTFDNKLEDINLVFNGDSKIGSFDLDSFESDYNKNINVNIFIPYSYNLKDFLYHYPNLRPEISKNNKYKVQGYDKDSVSYIGFNSDPHPYGHEYREYLFNQSSSYELDEKQKRDIKNKKFDFKSVSVFINNEMDLKNISFDKDSYYCTDLYGVKEFLYIQKEDFNYYEDINFYNDKEIEEFKKSYELIPKDKICK
jgi:hypothetical protein